MKRTNMLSRIEALVSSSHVTQTPPSRVAELILDDCEAVGMLPPRRNIITPAGHGIASATWEPETAVEQGSGEGKE